MKTEYDILYIINSLDIGGAEIGMCRLLDGLDQTEYNVIVVSLSGCNTIIEKKLPPWVRIIDLQLPSYPNRITRLISLIQNADIIVGSLFYSVLIARAIGWLNRDVTVATWQHNTRFKNKNRKRLYGLTNRFTDVLLADSEPVADFLADNFPNSSSKIHVVPIAGIQLEKYSVVNHSRTQNITVGTVGTLTKQKNHSAVLDVAASFPENEVSFEIAGDGKLRDKLLEEKQTRGLSNVTIRGMVHDIPEFLSKLDIYFQPSLYEGLCITVLEAMAAGLPVVGSNVGGINRNVIDNGNGYLYRPNDIEGYHSGIQKLAGNPELRTKFGQRSRTIVAENFTQDLLVSKFRKAIDEEYPE
jgi:glycosyltransferase involved in cell wall biosynthesis